MNIQIKSHTAVDAKILDGRVALVTGSTSSIGLGIARALAAAGANVMLNGFGAAAEIARTKDAIEADHGVKAGCSAADMKSPDVIAKMVAVALADLGRFDIRVNNAGIQNVAPLDQFPVEKWDQILAINLSSAFHTTRLALPAMRKQQFGRIINVASAHGLVVGAYVAAKHGIVGLTKVAALETAVGGITCKPSAPAMFIPRWSKLGSMDRPRRMGSPGIR